MRPFTYKSPRGDRLAGGVFDQRSFRAEHACRPRLEPRQSRGESGRTLGMVVRPKSARDDGTFCISCYTAAPFTLGRAALRAPLGEPSPSANERKLLENVVKRVSLSRELEPFYSDQTSGLPKTSESRRTESILDSLILVGNTCRQAISVRMESSRSTTWGRFSSSPAT
jgi:hypothetical protein